MLEFVLTVLNFVFSNKIRNCRARLFINITNSKEMSADLHFLSTNYVTEETKEEKY
jgi:hypothetical protein